MNALTYGQLPHGISFERIGQVFLYCRKCGNRYSADKRDYFWQPDQARVTCSNGHKGQLMILAREERHIIEVSV